MEQLNRVELVGIIGMVRLTEVGDTRKADFSLATNVIYRDREGSPVIETTWTAVSCFPGGGTCDLGKLERGGQVRVIGRLRVQRYVDAGGAERIRTEVRATTVELLGDAPLEPQAIR